MIRKLIRLFLDRHINRGFKQLEAGSRVLELTPAMELPRDGYRISARRIRSALAKADHARKEAKRLRDHRLEMEVASLLGTAGRKLA